MSREPRDGTQPNRRIIAFDSQPLTHPGIVTIYDVDRDERWCWIVSEYVAGRTLEEVMEQEQFAPMRAAQLAAQVADALHYAHKKGLFHRDLKPANILIDEHGQPHIADFGLAVSEETQRQQAGQVAGTPAYMSPEQARGDTHRLDGRTDIWSLGVLLYQLLTHRHPFWKGNVHDCLDEILNRDPKPPRQIDDTIPPGLERTCLKALAKNPDQRYTNAGDMAEDLRAVLHRKSVLRPVALSAIIGLFVVATAIILPRWMQPDTTDQQPSTGTSSGTSTIPVVKDNPIRTKGASEASELGLLVVEGETSGVVLNLQRGDDKPITLDLDATRSIQLAPGQYDVKIVKPTRGLIAAPCAFVFGGSHARLKIHRFDIPNIPRLPSEPSKKSSVVPGDPTPIPPPNFGGQELN